MTTSPKKLQGGLDVQKSDGTSALTVSGSTGAAVVGPSAGNVTHTRYGQEEIIHKHYTGGSSRSLSTSPSKSVRKYVVRDEFTNLTTSAWNINNGDNFAANASAKIVCFLKNTANDTASFVFFSAVDEGIAYKYAKQDGANCSITESSTRVFDITGLGDGLTYTITFGQFANTATIKASALTSGTTTLVMEVTALM